MKKLISLFIPLVLAAAVGVAQVDLSGMTYDELVELKDQLNLAMWNSEEWEEVVVPQGLWIVGEDIPVGHYTIKPVDGNIATVVYGCKLKENKANLEKFTSSSRYDEIISPSYRYYSQGDKDTIDIDMQYGYYVEIEDSSVVFTPYTGKPTLGFKKKTGSTSTGSTTAQVTPPKTTPRPQTTPYIDNSTGRRYIYIDYKNVARNPELYKNTKVFLKGKVVQVVGSRTRGYDIRLATSGGFDDIYYIVVTAEKTPSFNILEGDNLFVLCTLGGDYTYKAVLGNEITLPLATADSISLQE